MITILVAEDDKFLSSAYRLKFKKIGWKAVIVNDGQEVFEYLKTNRPDLILLDLIMPNMDGFEVLEKIKTQKNYRGLPVIVASNLGQKEDVERAMNLGATDFVIKSELTLDLLIEKIKHLLNLSV